MGTSLLLWQIETERRYLRRLKRFGIGFLLLAVIAAVALLLMPDAWRSYRR